MPMTTEERARMESLEEAVTRLEAGVGMVYAVNAPTDADLKPENELPSGRYPLLLSDYQIRKHGIAPMQADIEALQNADPAPLPPPNVEVPADLRAQLEAIGVVFATDGTIEAIKYTTFSEEGKVTGYAGMNDAAWRTFSNIRSKIGSEWPDTESNPNLPVLMGPVFERDGALSYDFAPPVIGGSSADQHPNKTFLQYFAGFRRGIGPREFDDVGPYMDFGSFEAGRGIRWFVRRPGSESPDTEVVIQMDAQGLAIRVAGGLRRITMAADGRLVAGDPIIEDQ
jgi:hypothetical protein